MIDRAHKKAMVKFMTRWKKFPNGLDFSVPTYRGHEFEQEMKSLGLVFYCIDRSSAGLVRQHIGWWKRLITLNFKKGDWVMGGVGLEDLVREDFIEAERIHRGRSITCYSVAPTKELLDEHERRR